MTVLVLIIILMTVGMFVAWYTARHNQVTIDTAPPAPVVKPVTKPVKPDPKTPVGVSVNVLTSPIKPGSNASITIKTKPLAACSIRVEYDKQASTDGGLVPKSADDYGVATWAWTVEPTRPKGAWPVDVTCAEDGKSGYVRGNLVIE